MLKVDERGVLRGISRWNVNGGVRLDVSRSRMSGRQR